MGTPTGVKLVRSIRRLVLSEKYAKPLFGTVKGTPWSLRGDGQFLPLTVTQTPAQAGAAALPPSTATPQQQATSETQAEEQQPPLPTAEQQPTTTTAMDTTTSTALVPLTTICACPCHTYGACFNYKAWLCAATTTTRTAWQTTTIHSPNWRQTSSSRHHN